MVHLPPQIDQNASAPASENNMAHSVDENASHEIHLPRPTVWPMLVGLGLGLIMFGFLFWRGSATEGLGLGLMGGGGVVLLLAVGFWLSTNIRARVRDHAEPLGGSEAAKFAMWAFIGTECILFGALIANMLYLWIRDTDVNHALHNLEALLIVSVNTFLLLTSSLCVVLGLSAIQRGDRLGLARWLGATAVLGAAFIGIQAFEYSKLYAEGITLVSDRFGSGFFFLTGFHGLHVFIGVLWALVLIAHTLRGGFTQADHMGYEVFGLYWHFVDVVWIFIFTLVYLL